LNIRTLGKSGFQVTEISLGAWQIGGQRYGPVSEQEAYATIQAYILGDGNFIDTARGYDNSERILGNYFQKYGGRGQVFIASKSGAQHAEQVSRDLEQTLRLLQTDYLDLYYLHHPPDDREDMLRLLDLYEGFKSQGKIRAIGASIKGPDVTQHTVDLCRQYVHSGRVDVLMVINSIFRQKNSEILLEARDQGVGIVARTILESGFLTGKYAPGKEFSGQDHRVRWSGERLRKILQQAQDLHDWAVQSPYEQLAQVALRFVLDQEGISSVVVGARTPAQIDTMIATAGIPALKPDLRARLVAEFKGKDADFNTGS
jgi:aryl-alcohol dehydrogenase-like predicted oxidoreductase